MAENTQQRFANCAKTRRGEHILFRDFGLDVTDRLGELTRGDVMDQVEKYFPNVRSAKVIRTGANSFDVELLGVSDD
jgi:hypothetical protein